MGRVLHSIEHVMMPPRILRTARFAEEPAEFGTDGGRIDAPDRGQHPGDGPAGSVQVAATPAWAVARRTVKRVRELASALATGARSGSTAKMPAARPNLPRSSRHEASMTLGVPFSMRGPHRGVIGSPALSESL
jgi:hypothetical protein